MVESTSGIKHYRRTHAWDYQRGASLFITMAIASRRALFGRVSGARVELSELGRIVDDSLVAIPRLNPGVRLYGRVVMPDHIHLIAKFPTGAAAVSSKPPYRANPAAVSSRPPYRTKQSRGRRNRRGNG